MRRLPGRLVTSAGIGPAGQLSLRLPTAATPFMGRQALALTGRPWGKERKNGRLSNPGGGPARPMAAPAGFEPAIQD